MAQVTCIFCGKLRKRAKEHVFAETLLKELGARSEQITIEHRVFADDSLESQRKPSYASLVCGDVCETCNNGWMSQLEGRVKPWILGIQRKEDLCFPDQDLRFTFARWALKTACVIDRIGTEHDIEESVARALFEMPDRLPERVTVFVGFLDSPGRNLFGLCKRNSWIEYPQNEKCTFPQCSTLGGSFKVAFSLGRLMVLVAMSPNAHLQFVLGTGTQLPVWPSSEYKLHHWFHTMRVGGVDAETALRNFCDLLAVSHGGRMH